MIFLPGFTLAFSLIRRMRNYMACAFSLSFSSNAICLRKVPNSSASRCNLVTKQSLLPTSNHPLLIGRGSASVKAWCRDRAQKGHDLPSEAER